MNVLYSTLSANTTNKGAGDSSLKEVPGMYSQINSVNNEIILPGQLIYLEANVW